MKKIIITLAVSLFALSASAQLRTAYFMDGSYLRTDMNPALIPDRGYFTLPVIGGFGLGLNNNFLSVDNFIYSRDGQTVTALDSRVQTADFVDKLPKVGHLNLNTDIRLLGVGFSTKKAFWNFGANVRVHADVAMDQTIFYALKSIGNGTYNLSRVGVDGNAYAELYLGACIPVKDWLRIGVKAKGIVGIMNINGQLSDSYFSVTRTDVTANLRGTLRASGIVVNPDYVVGEEVDLEQMMVEPLENGINSGGAAIDFGAEARLLNDRLRVSLGVTDLGFVCWSAKSAAAAAVEYNINYRGYNFDTQELDMTSDGRVVTATAEGYTRRLNTTLNIGAEYNILNDWIAFGVLSHTEFRQLYVLSELTLSANFRIGDHFTTTLSHTLCGRNRAGIFGFALNVHTAGLNLFLGTDYIDTTYVLAGDMVAPKYQKSLNYYFGLGFNLGQNKF
jgi:hypothetical protein